MIDICEFFKNGFCIQYIEQCKYCTPEQRCAKTFLNSKYRKIDVLLIESAIFGKDCNEDNFLFDRKKGISYLIFEG